MENKTYEITFKISTPLAINYPFFPTFDGIISYGYVINIYGDKDSREK